MNEEFEDLDFYLKRLNYYYSLLSFTTDEGLYPGYGSIHFLLDHEKIRWTYDFWKEGLIGYLKKETKRRVKAKLKDKETK